MNIVKTQNTRKVGMEKSMFLGTNFWQKHVF